MTSPGRSLAGGKTVKLACVLRHSALRRAALYGGKSRPNRCAALEDIPRRGGRISFRPWEMGPDGVKKAVDDVRHFPSRRARGRASARRQKGGRDRGQVDPLVQLERADLRGFEHLLPRRRKARMRAHGQRLDRMPSIRRFRISDANIGPNLCHQYRTVS